MKKILIVINSLATGGAERQVVSDANLLHVAGHDVTVAIHRLGNLMDRLAPKVAVKRLCSGNELLAMLEIGAYIRCHRFDAVFAHMLWAHKVAALPCHIACLPYVFFEHGLGLKRNWYHRFLVNRLDKYARRIVTVSEAKRAIKVVKENAPPEKLMVLANSFTPPSPRHDEGAVEVLQREEKPVIRIVFVGRFNRVKQLHLLVDIAADLLGKQFGHRFILCGDGPEFSALRLRIKGAGLEKMFSLMGHVIDPYEFLCKGDIFVLPSRVEDLSVALLEAGRAGLPALAFDVGGNREIIVDGETGFLIPPYDVHAFADKLQLLSRDAGLRKRMGDNARRRVMAKFSPEVRLRGLEQLLASL